jgi:3-deoxy-manno-octulosonate cytidylyltransferase (CMP-KDO synthetase)
VRFSVLIPARYESTRLPGKPLRMLAGKPMLAHVVERARESGAERVVVATDDERISAACQSLGVQVCMTALAHRSGTERLAEAVEQLGLADDEIVVNLQGDEPLMIPGLLRQVAQALAEHGDAVVATLCSPIHSSGELFDPHVVKVVRDAGGYALYFSRAAIPWHRDAFAQSTEVLPQGDGLHYRHIGVYAYRAGYIGRYAAADPSPLEQCESLEQLRVLWRGERIYVALTDSSPGHGIDTEQDLAAAERLLATKN